jgi:hypothetical protein
MTHLFSLLLVLWLALPVVAGQGRQTLVVETSYDYGTVCRWLERNADRVRESSGAMTVGRDGTTSTVQSETKRGIEVFRIRQYGAKGRYRAVFVQSLKGSVTDFECHIDIRPLPENRTSEMTVVLIAAASNSNSVEINVELRKSLRLMRTYIQSRLVTNK